MNIVLIAVPIMDYRGRRLIPIAQDQSKSCPPYGLYLLQSILKKQGHNVNMVDLIALGSHNLTPHLALIERSDLVGIGATSLSWPSVVDIIRQIKKRLPDKPIVLGGIHPTMFDRYILETFPVEFVIRGEAELALPALCQALEDKKGLELVPNLTWKTKDKAVIRNALGAKIDFAGYAGFPLPDYESLPINVYQGLAIESSRGCLFDCAFCSTSYRRSWRGMAAEVFVERLIQTLPYTKRTLKRVVQIIDDEFSTQPARAIEIINHLRRNGIKCRFIYDSRANDLLHEGFVETMAEYTAEFLVGAECGYDEGLRRVGKGTTCEKLEAAARLLNHYGLAGHADFSFILGLPWEGKTQIEKTIQFATDLFSEYGVRVMLQWYCMIPGSRLWEEEKGKHVVTQAMYNEFGFFRNLHLFHSSMSLSPKEIYALEDMILQLQWLANLAYPQANMIQHSVAEPLLAYYPRNLISENGKSDEGLYSLREVSAAEELNAAELPG